MNDETLWADAVYEICRASSSSSCVDGEIVWRWSSWDHVVQDVYAEIPETYVDNITEYANKIDLNYYATAGTDWMHINSVDYNPLTDEILLSVHNFNEYWVISHDAEKVDSGIVRRVGNPAAHGETGDQQLYVQHDARWIPAGVPGAGNILVFNNGKNRGDGNYSSVDEYCDRDDCNRGDLVSSYSEGAGGNFYADHISGAERFASGNTLVCEGTEGRIFEINSQNQIVWEFNYGAEIFRASRYAADYSGLQL